MKVSLTIIVVCSEECDTDHEGDVRLVNGNNKFEGRVEYCNDSEWKSICNSAFFEQEVMVACRQLRFSGNFIRKFCLW